MPFSKSFPRTLEGTTYPRWEEIFLTEEEERAVEERCRKENTKLFMECVEDAKKIMAEKNLQAYQSDLIRMAIALFEKRASHEIFWKESKAKEKFDLKEK